MIKWCGFACLIASSSGASSMLGIARSGSSSPCQQLVDRMLHKLDMADFLQKHAPDQIPVSGVFSPEVVALEKELHHGPHLAETAAERFLQDLSGSRIRFIRYDQVDQIFLVKIHGDAPLS